MVELNWEPPRESNGIIRSYIIYYQMDVQMPDDSWEIKNISGMFINFALSCLSIKLNKFV